MSHVLAEKLANASRSAYYLPTHSIGGGLELAAVSEQLPPLVTAPLERYCDGDVAEESTQEALARAVDRCGELQGPDRLSGWLVRVATNVIHSHHRRQEVAGRGTPLLAVAAQSTATDVEDTIVVRGLLSTLTVAQLRIVVLRYFVGYSVVETAEAHDCPQGTVKSLTHRAAAQLRRRLVRSR